MLQRYFIAKRFAGQNQCIMGSIYLENPELFNLIRVDKDYHASKWEYLLYYLT
jgi:hypothetical protein